MDYSQSNNIGRVADAINRVADNLLDGATPLEQLVKSDQKRADDMDYALTKLIELGERFINIIGSGLEITVTNNMHTGTQIKVRWRDSKGE